MKKLYTFAISLLLLSAVSAQKNTAIINNGNWNNSSSWSLNHVPANGETIEIPTNMTILVAGNIDHSTSQLAVQVAGSLEFDNGKLALGAASKITLLENATIKSIRGSNNNKISIGNVEKYNGSQGTLTGTLIASSTTGVAPNGFMASEPVVLPVKFASFTLATFNHQVLVKWSTAQEVDAAYFEVQRSSNGSSWTGITQVAALGNSNQLTHYQYTDRASQNGMVYYRIKQVDRNGKTMYTPVLTALPTAVKPIHIFNTNKLVTVQFAHTVKEKTEVVVMNRAGQVVSRQVVAKGAIQMVINQTANLKGAFFIAVYNPKGISASQQIIL